MICCKIRAVLSARAAVVLPLCQTEKTGRIRGGVPVPHLLIHQCDATIHVFQHPVYAHFGRPDAARHFRDGFAQQEPGLLRAERFDLRSLSRRHRFEPRVFGGSDFPKCDKCVVPRREVRHRSPETDSSFPERPSPGFARRSPRDRRYGAARPAKAIERSRVPQSFFSWAPLAKSRRFPRTPPVPSAMRAARPSSPQNATKSSEASLTTPGPTTDVGSASAQPKICTPPSPCRGFPLQP